MERLTDAQWALIEPHLPTRKPSAKGGRPPAADRAYYEHKLENFRAFLHLACALIVLRRL
jgi:transposase